MTLAQLLNASRDNETQIVETSSGNFYVRELTADEFDSFQEMYAGQDTEMRGVRAAFVGLCLCDEKGSPLQPTELEIEAIGKLPIRVVDPLFKAAQRLNGMSESVEDRKKNSGKTEPHGSG